MIKVTFINRSNIALLLTVGGETRRLFPGDRQNVTMKRESFTFFAAPDSISYLRYFFRKGGLISKRHFVVNSEYSFYGEVPMEIELYVKTAKGKFMDEYEVCIPGAAGGRIIPVLYRVSDEEKIKAEIDLCNKKSNRMLFFFDILDILGNALLSLLLLLIPFLLIWLFAGIEMALDICTIAFIPLFALTVVANRLFDRLRRKLFKKGKSFVLRKQIFKDSSSYFRHGYISSVIN